MTQRLSLLYMNLALLILFAMSGAAQATPIFSNFGVGYSYDTTTGLYVGDGNLDGSANFAQASAFTAGFNANLGSIVIALSDVFGQTDPITVAFTSDSGSNTPGSLLESFTIAANTLGSFGDNNPALTLNSFLHPLLISGTQYWISASTGLANTIAWNFNNTGDLINPNVQSQSLDGGITWGAPFGNTRGVFEVNPVPEPGTLALLAGGFLGLRRRHLREKAKCS